ncbi:MAG TPA: glycosyltransferase, partial [Nitrospiria bacterium]
MGEPRSVTTGETGDGMKAFIPMAESGEESKGPAVICFGFHPWSEMWKRNQSMMYHLSLRPDVGRVVFVNPGVWLTDLLFGRGLARFELGSLTRDAIASRRIGEKLTVMTPLHWFPLSRSFPPFSRLDVAVVSGRIRRAVGSDDYVAVVNSVDGGMEPIIDRVLKDASAVVFDWSDDFAEFYRDAESRSEVERLCRKYIRRADLVLAVNEHLAARARPLNPSSHVLINATNFPVMDRLPGVTEPGRQPEWPKTRGPVVGYLGWINEQRMDLDILDALTRRLSDWTFVFVGPLMFRPENRRAKEIFERPNVRLVPPVPFSELPAHLERFDVCILPFLINDHTNGNDPIKIYDYMAFGKSVVSTRTAGIERVERA